MTDYFERGLVTFTVCVLWMHGASAGNIALMSKRTRGSVAGIINRAFDKPREQMTIEERQARLDEMKAKRRDEGRLPAKFFIAMEILPKSDKPKAPLKFRELPPQQRDQPEVKPEPVTVSGKKKSRHKQKQEEHRRNAIEKAAREEREQGRNTKRGFDGNALEHLHTMRILADPADRFVDSPVNTQVMSSGVRRHEAGQAFRATIDGCRVGGVSSVDFEREVRGSGAAAGIPAWRLQCLSSLGAIRKALPEADYATVEGIIDRDEMPWEAVKSSTAKKFLFETIRRSLDVIAVLWSYMSEQAFEARWGFIPDIPSALDDDEARQLASLGRQLLREGQRTA